MYKLIIPLIAIVLVSGCIEIAWVEDVGDDVMSSATANCINLCNQQKDAGRDLSNGPCLSNEISPNWVCDIAHDPREDVDNQPENQCEAFRNETARHFVEVDLSCNLIRTY